MSDASWPRFSPPTDLSIGRAFHTDCRNTSTSGGRPRTRCGQYLPLVAHRRRASSADICPARARFDIRPAYCCRAPGTFRAASPAGYEACCAACATAATDRTAIHAKVAGTTRPRVAEMSGRVWAIATCPRQQRLLLVARAPSFTPRRCRVNDDAIRAACRSACSTSTARS